MNQKSFVEVYEAQGYLAAEMVRLYLESAGLEAQVLQESAGLVYGLTVGPLGLAKILVPIAQKEEAILLLEQMDGQNFSENDEDFR
jgi:hypothetical protein